MTRDEIQVRVQYGVLALAFVAALGFVSQLHNREVKFCRSVLSGLIDGDPSVLPLVNWEHFNAVGLNIGDTYTHLADEHERVQYEESFVAHFSEAFHKEGRTVKDFTNWRKLGERGNQVAVAADYPAKNKTLLFLIPADGPKKLEGLQWQ